MLRARKSSIWMGNGQSKSKGTATATTTATTTAPATVSTTGSSEKVPSLMSLKPSPSKMEDLEVMEDLLFA